jgi:hypothetical protein|tara:strand:+ start:324 stop:458 length:135 start_codon:yes stop_codon:yes gene_type:complete
MLNNATLPAAGDDNVAIGYNAGAKITPPLQKEKRLFFPFEYHTH